MSYFHVVARRCSARVADAGRSVAGAGADISRDLAQSAPATVEGGARLLLALAEVLPLLIDDAPNLTEELFGLRASARDGRARLLLGRTQLRLRAREDRGAL